MAYATDLTRRKCYRGFDRGEEITALPGGMSRATLAAMDDILDVDLLAFERGTATQRAAVVDGVRRSLATGFVYTRHDLSEDLLDTAYGMLAEFFSMPQEVKQRFVAPGQPRPDRATPGCWSRPRRRATCPTGRRCSTGAASCPTGHPLRPAYPHRYGRQVLPEAAVPGITEVLNAVPRPHRRPPAPVPAGHRRGHRLPRVVLRRDDARTAPR